MADLDFLYRKKGEAAISISVDADELSDLVSVLTDIGIELIEVNESDEYLAGFLDGEGTITISKSGKWLSPRIVLPQSHLGLVSILRSMIGVGAIHKAKNGCYHLIVTGSDNVYSVLSRVRDSLILKRDRADLLMRFISIRKLSKYGDGYGVEEISILDDIRYLNLKPSLKT